MWTYSTHSHTQLLPLNSLSPVYSCYFADLAFFFCPFSFRWVTVAMTTRCTRQLNCFTTTCPTSAALPPLWCTWESTRQPWTELARPTAPAPGRRWGMTMQFNWRKSPLKSKESAYCPLTHIKHIVWCDSLLGVFCLCRWERVPSCPDVWPAYCRPRRWTGGTHQLLPGNRGDWGQCKTHLLQSLWMLSNYWAHTLSDI